MTRTHEQIAQEALKALRPIPHGGLVQTDVEPIYALARGFASREPVAIPGGLQTAPVAVPAASSGGFALGTLSEKRLEDVHPDLVKVVRRAIATTDLDFTVLEGLRTLARQKQLVAKGASRTMNSRHLTGHAVDLGVTVNGEVRWDWPLYHRLAKVVKQAAKDVGVTVEWGGDWHSFKDGPHWQLPFATYPK